MVIHQMNHHVTMLSGDWQTVDETVCLAAPPGGELLHSYVRAVNLPYFVSFG
jgi:hypothetical protein